MKALEPKQTSPFIGYNVQNRTDRSNNVRSCGYAQGSREIRRKVGEYVIHAIYFVHQQVRTLIKDGDVVFHEPAST